VQIAARGQVILSAGALQSPQLLMLSGIGDPTALQAAGVPVQHALPGVGRKLQDHIDCLLGYRLDDPALLGLWSGFWRDFRDGVRDYRRERRGIFTSTVNETGGFARTTPGLPMPDVQMIFAHALSDNHGRTLRWGRGIAGHVCLLHPHSVGQVTLESPDPLAAPRIDTAFLSDPRDLETLLRGVKLLRRIVEHPSLHVGTPRPLHDEPMATDDDLRAYIRRHADTLYHPVGTCRMGPAGDPGAVVDAALRVHGIQGLRVVDASIMPTLPGGNTNAPTVMVAEKAADLIRAEDRG
jgi:choline dehydrogenase-like flavoprotein